MPPKIDPAVVTLLGSRTRAATLGALANASSALTAYRLARITGLQPIKVSAELRRLRDAGFLAATATEQGRVAWTLTDDSLRSFLRPRVRLVWLDDLNATIAANIRKRATQPKLNIDLRQFKPNPSSVPNRKEFLRSPWKDRTLAALGLRISRRRKSPR